ncbi:hypothetical protein TB927.1.4920 [Trypanosoma brucei brucei TREU927]|uniref:Uncharacterized protein n=1 Tax=Trypanosoma brucei brucei (strain 927/4 GUTat10.1) TaxID=185431 RepID=Q4GY88_TRYB2|nr:hypothetical protein TB927.1.4920 [Trypanosoma brucei brucei TREU927]CAJ16698.1 hypothetical protein TB927.1.4920 [Trypanosoma brucei brucei TREU927]
MAPRGGDALRQMDETTCNFGGPFCESPDALSVCFAASSHGRSNESGGPTSFVFLYLLAICREFEGANMRDPKACALSSLHTCTHTSSHGFMGHPVMQPIPCCGILQVLFRPVSTLMMIRLFAKKLFLIPDDLFTFRLRGPLLIMSSIDPGNGSLRHPAGSENGVSQYLVCFHSGGLTVQEPSHSSRWVGIYFAAT